MYLSLIFFDTLYSSLLLYFCVLCLHVCIPLMFFAFHHRPTSYHLSSQKCQQFIISPHLNCVTGTPSGQPVQSPPRSCPLNMYELNYITLWSACQIMVIFVSGFCLTVLFPVHTFQSSSVLEDTCILSSLCPFLIL